MNFLNLIKDISDEFNAAWNRWDIEKMMEMMTNDVTIFSPKISMVYPDNESNSISGKENIRNYWMALHGIMGHFTVEMVSFKKEGRLIQTKNRVIGYNIIIEESFTLNEYGKIMELRYHYLEE
ncbi:MAG: nuclear transport factor 2 family protein [Chitinophagaceae bacterium]|nr:nuclear transport factor 2 family protein [Chitinophagaceae bacterium]